MLELNYERFRLFRNKADKAFDRVFVIAPLCATRRRRDMNETSLSARKPAQNPASPMDVL